MGKLTIEKAQPERKKTEWFQIKGGGAIYRRGDDGICITSTGQVCTGQNYGGETYKVFDNPNHYEPLYEGDQIVITL